MAIADYGALVAADPALEALDALTRAVALARQRLDEVEERADHLRHERRSGRPYAEIVADEPHPFIVELLTALLDELADAGSTFRRAKARALRDEGLSQEAIAAHFGVTRQRVAALLAEPPRRGQRGRPVAS
jgi:hypothetical protein